MVEESDSSNDHRISTKELWEKTTSLPQKFLEESVEEKKIQRVHINTRIV